MKSGRSAAAKMPQYVKWEMTRMNDAFTLILAERIKTYKIPNNTAAAL